MPFRSEIHRADEVIGFFFAGVRLNPVIVHFDPLDIGSHPPGPLPLPEIVRLDSRRSADHRSGRSRRRLGEEGDVSEAVGSNFFPNLFGHLFHETALQQFFRIEEGETAFLFGEIAALAVRLDADEPVELVDEFQRGLASIRKLHLDQHIRKAHRPQSDPSFALLLLPVLFEEIRRIIDDVVQKADA